MSESESTNFTASKKELGAATSRVNGQESSQPIKGCPSPESSLIMSRCISVLLLFALVHLDQLGSAQPVDQLAALKSMKAAVEELQAERRGEQEHHLMEGTNF